MSNVLGKIRNILKCHLLKFLQSMLSLKTHKKNENSRLGLIDAADTLCRYPLEQNWFLTIKMGKRTRKYYPHYDEAQENLYGRHPSKQSDYGVQTGSKVMNFSGNKMILVTIILFVIPQKLLFVSLKINTSLV